VNKSTRYNNRFRPNSSKDATAQSFDFIYGLELFFRVVMVAIFVTLTTLLFIFIENTVTQSNLLAIKEISVSGTHILSKEEVIEQAEIFPEDNIFSVNLRHTRLRIIAHPWIEDASVKRSMPSKIIITVKEEIPLAVVHIPDRADIILNRKGIPFTENDAIGSDIFVNDIRNSTSMSSNSAVNEAGGQSDLKHSGSTGSSINSEGVTYPNSDTDGGNAASLSDNENSTSITLPVITGLKLSKQGEIYGFSGRLYTSVMELLLMKRDEVIQKISADEESGIEVDLIISERVTMSSVPHSPELIQQPVKIKVGFDNYEEKFKIIRHIMNYMQKNRDDKQVCSIDVINPENVVIKVKDITVNTLPEQIEGGA